MQETYGNKWKHVETYGQVGLFQPVLVVWRKRTLKIAFKETNLCVLVLRLVERLRNAHKSIINSRTNNWTLFDWGS